MKVGIVGASFARAAYLPALRLIAGVEVVAIASSRMESARSAAEAFGAARDWSLFFPAWKTTGSMSD